MVRPVGSYIVTYVPPKLLAGCNGFTSGTWVLFPAIPLTYTLPFASRRGGPMESAALRSGLAPPMNVAQTSPLPAGLIFARNARFWHKVLGHGFVSLAPAVTGK